MTALTKWCSRLSTLGVGLSGLVLFWMAWCLVPQDPYAVVNHPAQPLWKSLHVMTAPFLTLSIGYLWCQHAWGYWQAGIRSGRRSGLLLLASALPMILSGYAIQVVLEMAVRTFWVWVHVISSGLWLAGMMIHVAVHCRRPGRAG